MSTRSWIRLTAVSLLLSSVPVLAGDDVPPPPAPVKEAPAIGRRRSVSAAQPSETTAAAKAADPSNASTTQKAPAQPAPEKATGGAKAPKKAAAEEAASETGAKAPKIVFDETVFDFGEADSTQTIEHGFRFRNEGDATLKIPRVRAHCGCTVVDQGPREIPPGGEGVITAQVRLRGFRGPVQKAIDVYTNDPSQPNPRLTIKGKVRVDIDIRPNTRVFFGRVQKDTRAERTLRIKSMLDAPLEITGRTIRWTGMSAASRRLTAGKPSAGEKKEREGTPPFEADLRTIEDGREYEAVIRLVPPLPFGSLTAELVLRTNSQKHPEIRIPITAYVTAPVTASPSIITFVRSRPESNRRPIYVRRFDGKPLKITGVRAEPGEYLKAALEKKSAADFTQRITVTMLKPPENRLSYGRVTIYVDDREIPEIEVKVRFIQ